MGELDTLFLLHGATAEMISISRVPIALALIIVRSWYVA
jgi:hypothetical protein